MRTILVILVSCAPCCALDVTSHLAVHPNFDQAMAALIVQENANLTLNPGASTQIAGAGEVSEPRAAGFFTGGNTAAGTLLPAQNRNAEFPNAAYSGGIGFDTGIILTTGLADDQTPEGQPALAQALGVGAEGPNNGLGIDADVTNDGEISKEMARGDDADFFNELGQFGGDASVLQFTVTMANPGYLRVRFVHATDEYPAWSRQTFSDTPMMFVDGKNAITFRSTANNVTTEAPLSLRELERCGFLKSNDVAPEPAFLQNSDHAVGTHVWYDHEYGGFSVPIIKESQLLNCGTHTFKLVIQDVTDTVVDSALFIESDSLQAFPFCKGDFNLDGHVDSGDYVIWRNNAYRIMTGAKVTDGDADADGRVDGADYVVWRANYGCVGNGDFAADFNRDGSVDSADYVIWRNYEGLANCADRFQGDADGDGDVDQDDYTIWQSQFGSGARGDSAAATASTEGGIIAELHTEATPALQAVDDRLKDVFLPLDGDADHDGDFDGDDLKIIDQMLGI